MINNNNDHAQVLLNRAAGGTHWIRVDPAPRIGTPEGTLVSLRSDGATTASRTWHTAGSYASASDGAAAFGLGSDAAPVDVLVHWPNGERELFTGLEIDREVTLSQGSGSQGSGSQRSGVEP